MNKLIKIIQFIGISIILYSGYSNAMQYGQPAQPLFPQNPYGQLQQPQGRRLARRPVEEVTVETTKLTQTTPIAPQLLKSIDDQISKLWTLYKKAPRTQTGFNEQYSREIENTINRLEQLIQSSNNADLQEALKPLIALSETSEFYNEDDFIEVLNGLIEIRNEIARITPTGPYQQQKFALSTIPYIIGAEEPSALYSAQQVITSPLYGVYDWTKGAIVGTAQTLYGYGQSAMGALGSGLGAAKRYVAPSAEDIRKATKALPQIEENIKVLKAKKTLSEADNQELERLTSLKNQYKSRLRGWKPALAGAAATAAGGYLLYKKYGGGGAATP